MAIISNKYSLKKACLRNSKNLLKESTRLLNRKKYAWATFLAITSFEESQKLGLLHMLEANYLSESKFNKFWRSHEYKIRSKDARIRFNFDTSEKIKPTLVLGSKQEAHEVMNMRESCLYVDFAEKSISEPLKINIAIAIQYINEATRELESANFLELLQKRLHRVLKVKK
ncbi:MAG TPA: AbiV family abortive infection protein [Patescibacteria group bacterium]|nr:AbiV family abortive infection protein [Patescibacteria group bacterium]